MKGLCCDLKESEKFEHVTTAKLQRSLDCSTERSKENNGSNKKLRDILEFSLLVLSKYTICVFVIFCVGLNCHNNGGTSGNL